MPHEIGLISTIATGLGLALVLGFLAVRLHLPPLIGYLGAGIIVGPFTPGFVANAGLAAQLAEIGVMLLMFGVGLHFSLDDLLSVKRIALPGALLQIAVATGMGWGLTTFWGWPGGQGFVFGLALSVASTVVLLRALETLGTLDSINGRIAVGWLIVEDLVMVLVLVLLPPLAVALGGTAPGETGTASDSVVMIALTLGKVALFIVLMLVVGRKLFPWLLWQVARTGSRELFTLCVIATAVGLAQGSAQLFGVSFALGAFFAGMVLRESALSHRTADETLPFRDAFAVLFFVSVGMLFDPRVLVTEPVRVLLVTGVIIIGKSTAAFLLVLAFRYPLNTALTVSASLAQIGEFSFILLTLGSTLGLVTPEGQSLVLAGAILSIALNPLIFKTTGPAQTWILKRSRLARAYERSEDGLAELPGSVPSSYLTGHIILVGFGRVGSRIGDALTQARAPFVVLEHNREFVETLRDRGVNAIAGEPSDANALIQAHVMRACAMVVAVPDPFALNKILETARTLNPQIKIVARTHSDEDAERLRSERVDHVFLGEHELAAVMATRALELMSGNTGGK